MVPFDAFSTDAPHSSIDFCNGCVAGTQCDSLSVKFLSCANAGVASAASAAPINYVRIFIASLPWLIGCFVLIERGLELLHDRVGVTSGFAHVVGPRLAQ